MKYIIFLFISVILFISGCQGPTVCTQEGMSCPDGSVVGRTGPNCEFEECPPPICNSMDLSEAIKIAGYSECIEQGDLENISLCNRETKTWWIEINMEKPGCNPACVIDTETKTAEINWRCTGLVAD
jgi:hypothetical protein